MDKDRFYTLLGGLFFGGIGLALYSLGGTIGAIGGFMMIPAGFVIVGTIIAIINLPTEAQLEEQAELEAFEKKVNNAVNRHQSQTLLALLDADDSYMQSLAAKGLSKLKDPDTIMPIIEKVKQGKIHAGAMEYAFDGLGTSTIDPLLAELESGTLDDPATLVAGEILCAFDDLTKEAIQTITDSQTQLSYNTLNKYIKRRAANNLAVIRKKSGADIDA